MASASASAVGLVCRDPGRSWGVFGKSGAEEQCRKEMSRCWPFSNRVFRHGMQYGFQTGTTSPVTTPAVPVLATCTSPLVGK